MSQSIVVTSGKGGSGKSSLVCCVGQALASKGKSVALVDMDMGMRSLDLMLSVQDRVVYDLADVADGTCRLKQALVRVHQDRELYVLNAAQTRGPDSVSPAQMENIARKLKEKFDFVFIDCPAGVGRGFRSAAAGADSAILVAQMDMVSIRDAERVVGLLEKCDVAAPKLVINRVPTKKAAKGAPTPENIAESLKLPLIGAVPDDPGFDCGRPDEGPAADAFARIAQRLLGTDIPIERVKPPSYFARVARALAGK